MRRSLRDESGVTLIQAAVLMLFLTGFVAVTVDYGVLLVARGQAQGAADAGALAGITSRLFDETGIVANGKAVTAAKQTAESNKVFGAFPNAFVFEEDDANACAPGAAAGAKCVRVDVYREGANAIPTLMAGFIGIDNQKVRATATASLVAANWANCIKPWFVADKYTELGGDPNLFDLGVDSYTAPGYKIPNDVTGEEITLVAGNAQGQAGNGEWFRADLIGGGSATYGDNISGCTNVPPSNPQLMQILPGQGPSITKDAVGLVGKTVPIMMFSPVDQANRVGNGASYLPVVNMMGLKITYAEGTTVKGYISALAGEVVAGGGGVTGGGGFIQAPVLTR